MMIPAGAAIIIFAAAFHRDEGKFPFADRFEPEIWLDGRAHKEPSLVPFSGGPAECPGKNVVLLTTTTLLAITTSGSSSRSADGTFC
ncbi:Cytochrome P450 monooxygenase [Hoyosella subflava DQS3-9A1]|uniref:Cytochrome P450 monooxygenase n=2 Tax=Hoyosella TaxID=697025 RepID=F6EGD2_HOYSD|nr:Cytochrome P450 monooxygenase [Hoyosella subflava DQS3-9A1]